MLQTTLMLEITYLHGFDFLLMKRGCSISGVMFQYAHGFMTYQQTIADDTPEVSFWINLFIFLIFRYEFNGVDAGHT